MKNLDLFVGLIRDMLAGIGVLAVFIFIGLYIGYLQ